VAITTTAMATKSPWLKCFSKGAAMIQIHAVKAGVPPAATRFEIN
jgi:hypothetical protein